MNDEFNWKEILVGGWLYAHPELEVEVAHNRTSMNQQIKAALEVAFERIAAMEANSAVIDALAKRVEVLEYAYKSTGSTFAHYNKRLSALEAAQKPAGTPAPVASWLESAVASIEQFARAAQGEWASVQPEYIPDGLLKYRALQDEMDTLGDEIAAAQQPAPAAEWKPVREWTPDTLSDVVLNPATGTEYKTIPVKDFEAAIAIIGDVRSYHEYVTHHKDLAQHLSDAIRLLKGEALS